MKRPRLRKRVVFLIGRPLGHSLSSVFQNAAFEAKNLPLVYQPLELSSSALAAFFKILRESPDVLGCNVTVPYKEKVLPYLEELDAEAARAGSVNTIVRKKNRLVGYSTDGLGFWRALGAFQKRFKGSFGVFLGAGGAARAVLMTLAQKGIRGAAIVNRTQSKAFALQRKLRRFFPDREWRVWTLQEASQKLGEAAWVIQGTSVGLNARDPNPLPLHVASANTLAVDLIYHRRTRFLQEARQKGLPTLNGLGMLLHQGALAFEHWTGKRAPIFVMQRALNRALPGAPGRR